MVDESGLNPNLAKERLSSSQSPEMRNQPDSRRLNLLVVEDNLPDALLVKEAIRMEDLPLEVHLITDGQEAIEFIERAEEDPNAPCPHFLVIDLNLPKRSGFEVLQRLRASEKCKTIPALVITSSDSADDRKRAAGCGAVISASRRVTKNT
jgi:CheY-like chemotaxis protein